MNIRSRDYAAALSYLGADVESAILAVVATSPHLRVKVEAALAPRSEKPKLTYVADRSNDRYVFVCYAQPRYISVMHAIDLLGLVLDDSHILTYLKAKFPTYNVESLC